MSQRSKQSNKGDEDNQSEAASSKSIRSSSSQKITIAIATAKAKAKAAQARAAHAQKEIELKVEQARIQANLDALKEEKEKDAALAEANTLIANLQDTVYGVRSEANTAVPQADKDQRVAAYVTQQINLHNMGSSEEKESNNALPTFPPAHPQPNNFIPSTPHPLFDDQTQVPAPANITLH